MDSPAATGLFFITSVALSLIINLLFYHLLFKKKQTRMKANLFSWLATLVIMVPIVLGLVFLFTTDVTGGLGLIGWALLMVAVFAPIFWFIPPTLYTLIRAIVIVLTKDKIVPAREASKDLLPER